MTDENGSGHAVRTAERRGRHATGIRGRLIGWMLVAVGVAVLLLGVPLAVVVRQWVYAQEVDVLRREAEQVVAFVVENPADVPITVATSARLFGVRVTLLNGLGRVLRDSQGVAPGTQFDDLPVRTARREQVGAELIGGTLVVAVRGSVGRIPVIVRIADVETDAPARVGTASLVIIVLAATALAVGAALTSWRARQLARPLEALAESARQLGEGDFSLRSPGSDIAEIDNIAASLNATAARLRAALERSASLSADASHQLRTPLTALRLNLEALAADLPAPSPSLEAADAEIDRLESTIAELLTLADAGAGPDAVDLRALTLERLDAWRTLADAEGRAVRLARSAVPLVRARPAAVGQALQVLLDNALTHGVGDVTVWVQPVRRGERTWVRMCVGDEGPGPASGDLTAGEGRGLPLARSLIEAEGGRLVLDGEDRRRACLVLPAADDSAAADWAGADQPDGTGP